MTASITGLTSHEYQYQFDGRNVRVSLAENGDPLFVAKDVCEILGLDWNSDVKNRIPDWCKGGWVQATTLGGNQDLAAITEGGVYWIALKSKKPEAEAFQKWVCTDVLPAIWHQGYYLHNPTPASERVIRLRLRLKAAELREEAGKLDALARGDHEIVTEVPVGYTAIDPFLLDGGFATAATVARIRPRILGRLRGAKPLTQRVPAKQGSRSGSSRRRLYRTIDLHHAAEEAGLMQASLTFEGEV